MKRLQITILLLNVLIYGTLPSFSIASESEPETISVEFFEAPLSDILFMVAEKTETSFILNAPEQTISWVQNDIPVYSLLEEFLSVVQSVGLVLHETGTNRNVFTITDSSTPLSTSRDSLGYIHLRHIPSDVLKDSSEVLYKDRLAINPLEGTSVVLLSGDPLDVRQFMSVVKKVDVAKEPDISTYRFKHISTRMGLKSLEDSKVVETFYPDFWNRSILIKGTEYERSVALVLLNNLDQPQIGWVDKLEYIHTTETDNIIPLLNATCGNVTVYKVAEDRILLSGYEEDVERASNILNKIDGAGLQVKVEAVIAYLTDREYKELGTRIKVNSGDFRFNINDPLFGNSIGLLSEAVESFFRLEVSGEDSTNHGQIISSPVLTVLNGETARLHVGQNVPIIKETNVDNGDENSSATSIERQDVGVTFNVTPIISPSAEFVNLKLDQVISHITAGTELEQQFSDIVIDKQELSSSIRVADGQTIFLGGLSVDEEGHHLERIPLLGYIPILGNIFSYKSDRTENRNLVVSIRVNIIGG